MCGPCNDHIHVSVNIAMILGGWELPLCEETMSKLLEENFGVTAKESI